MKRYCLLDSKHTWKRDVSISDLAPNAEAFAFFFFFSLSLYLITDSCTFSDLSTKLWVMFARGRGGGWLREVGPSQGKEQREGR